MCGDPGLLRFLEAQEDSYARAILEIRRGAKRTHWMWFIFPQIVGLGQSAMAQHYGIRSLAEARAYLAHPILGARYEECVAPLQDLSGVTALQIFDEVDAMKLRSSLTLFSEAGGHALIEAALLRWFGQPDQATLDILRAA